MRHAHRIFSLPDKLLYFLLPSLFFVTPLSSSAKSILMGITLVMVLCSTTCRLALKEMLVTRWFRAVIILFGIALLGCLWSPATLGEKGLVLEKWSKLLTLPLLMVGFQQPKTRLLALKGFVLAMFLTCMVSLFMTWTGLFQTVVKTPESVFRNHIMTSMMMAFATYISLWFLDKGTRKEAFFYGALALLFSYHLLFINQSRSGYVFYVLLMGTFILQRFNKRQVGWALIGFGLFCLTATLVSPTIQHSVSKALENVQTYEQDKNTSLGYRMQFHQFARQLFRSQPFVGHGTGSFTYSFRTENPVPAWTNDPTHSGRLLEPHSQYWLVAAELGILGLGALALFYIELCRLALRLPTMRTMAIALLLIFAIGNLSDSLLFYSGSGYFFLLFFALCFSEITVQSEQTEASLISDRVHHAPI